MYTSVNNKSQIILSSNSNETEFWSLNYTLTCKNVSLNASKNTNVVGEISIKLPNGLLGVNVYKTLMD